MMMNSYRNYLHGNQRRRLLAFVVAGASFCSLHLFIVCRQAEATALSSDVTVEQVRTMHHEVHQVQKTINETGGPLVSPSKSSNSGSSANGGAVGVGAIPVYSFTDIHAPGAGAAAAALGRGSAKLISTSEVHVTASAADTSASPSASSSSSYSGGNESRGSGKRGKGRSFNFKLDLWDLKLAEHWTTWVFAFAVSCTTGLIAISLIMERVGGPRYIVVRQLVGGAVRDPAHLENVEVQEEEEGSENRPHSPTRRGYNDNDDSGGGGGGGVGYSTELSPMGRRVDARSVAAGNLRACRSASSPTSTSIQTSSFFSFSAQKVRNRVLGFADDVTYSRVARGGTTGNVTYGGGSGSGDGEGDNSRDFGEDGRDDYGGGEGNYDNEEEGPEVSLEEVERINRTRMGSHDADGGGGGGGGYSSNYQAAATPRRVGRNQHDDASSSSSQMPSPSPRRPLSPLSALRNATAAAAAARYSPIRGGGGASRGQNAMAAPLSCPPAGRSGRRPFFAGGSQDGDNGGDDENDDGVGNRRRHSSANARNASVSFAVHVDEDAFGNGGGGAGGRRGTGLWAANASRRRSSVALPPPEALEHSEDDPHMGRHWTMEAVHHRGKKPLELRYVQKSQRLSHKHRRQTSFVDDLGEAHFEFKGDLSMG